MRPDPDSTTAEPRGDSEHAGVVRSAGVVSGAVLLSRLTGLAREIAFATFFGSGVAYDAYIVAFRIPNLTRDLLAEGALSSAFVSTFSKTLARDGREAAFRLSNRLATVLAPGLALLCLAGVIFAPNIVQVMAPGFAETPGKAELTVLLTRVMLPFLLFVSLAAKSMGVLNSLGSFAVPALASAVFNITSLSCGLALGFLLGPRLGFDPIVGMAIGTLLGGLTQYLWQVPDLRRRGLRYRLDLDLSDPGLRQVLRLMGPAVVGAAAVQVNVVVNTMFASNVPGPDGDPANGPVSWLSYAFRFMQLPLGLFGVAIAAATLPAISKSAGRGDMAEFRETLSRSLGLVFMLTLPAAVGLAVLSDSIVGLIYQHGEFSAFDTRQTSLALSSYALGLVGYAAIKVLTPAFYALDDVRAPVAASLSSIVLNYGLNWYFLRVLGWGHWGLALSTSLVATLNFLALFWILRAKVGGLRSGRLVTGLVKIAAAAAAMGLVCWLTSSQLGAAWGDGFGARAALLAIVIPVGVGTLYGLCRLLKVAELQAAEEAVIARFSRR